MPKVDRAKLKKLLKELDSEKIRAMGSRVKGVGVAAKARVSAVVEEQRRARTPEARTYRAIVSRTEQVSRQKSEAQLQEERQRELEELRKAKEAEAGRRRVEREIFEEKYGEQIRRAKVLGKGIAKGAVALGKGVAGVGKLAVGTETLEETRQRVARAAEVGKKRGFVAEPLRSLGRERAAEQRTRRQEDVASFLEGEGISRKEARSARQAGDMFDFPDFGTAEVIVEDFDIGF